MVPGMPCRVVTVMAWICGQTSPSTGTESHPTTTSFSSTFHQSHTNIHAQRTLIGASRDGTLFVIDFTHGTHAAVTESGGGAILSLVSLCATGASCCGGQGRCFPVVAAGCEDGSIRVFQLNKNNKKNTYTFELLSTIPCAGSPILSLAWNRQGTTDSHTVLYAGVADGTIRRWESTTASRISSDQRAMLVWKSSLRMTVESQGRRTPTKVWALVALSDGTVVSGDSLGHVQFWDGPSGTMLQTFDQNDHKADVLALVATHDETKVYASGVDSRVISIERALKSFEHGPRPWILTQARRPHTHDVNALTICRLVDRKAALNPDKEQQEILCSGGMDTKICTYLVSDFKRARPKSWYPWPTISPITLAKEARLLCMLREDTVELHQIAAQQQLQGRRILLPGNETLLGTIDIKSRYNLVCADISPNGKVLAVSDGASLMIFELQFPNETNKNASFMPQKVALDTSLRSPCLALKFASNEQLICATSDGPIRVLQIGVHEPKDDNNNNPDIGIHMVTEAHVFDEHITDSVFPIHSICVRGDGKWFAATRSGLGNECVHIFTLPFGNDGSYGHWWSLPALEAPISSVRFLEGEDPEIVAACSNFSFYVFNVITKSLGEWSEQQGFPLTPKLPYELTHQNDAALRCVTNPATPNKFLLATFGSFCAVDLSQPLPEQARVFPPEHVRGKRKRKQRSEGQDQEPPSAAQLNTNCTICLRYNGMLFIDFIDANEMLVVEQPWLNVVRNFPAALERKVYGT